MSAYDEPPPAGRGQGDGLPGVACWPPVPPLIKPPEITTALPPTWCVIVCEQGCDQSWTLDTAEWSPPLDVQQVEWLLTPLLLAHEIEHGRRW